MEILSKMLIAAFIAAITENTILTRALGTSTLLVASRSKKQSILFGICITYISAISSIPVYFINKNFTAGESGFLYLPLAYVAVVGIVYIVTLLILWRFFYKLFKSVKKFVHFSAFNSAVLGALFLNNLKYSSIWEYIGYGFGTGLGFLFACLLVAYSNEKLTSDEIPESFRGVPVTMIYIGILSMAFFAMTGKIPLI